jgi:hypothetical protein
VVEFNVRNANAFPVLGGRRRLLDLLRWHCGSARHARGHLGCARRQEAGRGPRRLAASAPDRRSLRHTRSIGACRHKPSALTFIATF